MAVSHDPSSFTAAYPIHVQSLGIDIFFLQQSESGEGYAPNTTSIAQAPLLFYRVKRLTKSTKDNLVHSPHDKDNFNFSYFQTPFIVRQLTLDIKQKTNTKQLIMLKQICTYN